jgi:hypothetical protein
MEQRFGRPTPPLTAQEEADLATLRKKYDNFRAPWTLATDADRIALIKMRWGEQVARELDYVYEVIQRQNNARVHPWPIGYGLAMSPGRRQINRVGPDQRWRDALAHGVLGYHLTCRVVADEFGFDKDVLAERFHYASCLTRSFTDEELASGVADAPCVCGSGRALNDCHQS